MENSTGEKQTWEESIFRKSFCCLTEKDALQNAAYKPSTPQHATRIPLRNKNATHAPSWSNKRHSYNTSEVWKHHLLLGQALSGVKSRPEHGFFARLGEQLWTIPAWFSTTHPNICSAWPKYSRSARRIPLFIFAITKMRLPLRATSRLLMVCPFDSLALLLSTVLGKSGF
jgi:hypothetical protein